MSLLDVIWGFIQPAGQIIPQTFGDTVAALNNLIFNVLQIFTEVAGLPQKIFVIFISIITMMLYPVASLITVSYYIGQYVWFLGTGTINMMISLPQAAITMIQLFITMGLPPVWIAIFYLMIIMNVAIRIYNAVSTIIRWTPLKLLTGG